MADEFTPETVAELARFLAENAGGESRRLLPVGGRTAIGAGFQADPGSLLVATRQLDGVVEHAVRDMTITVEAGIRLESLEQILAAAGQRLPVEVPEAHRATLGGVIATDTSGPRRYGCGTIRDYLIGIEAITAEGQVFRAGGRVVKNVAGYDLPKLMIGSLGSLAIISEATLKLRPLAASTAICWAAFESYLAVERALEALVTSAARPVVIDLLDRRAAGQITADARANLSSGGPVLCLGVEGGEAETAWQAETLVAELERLDAMSVVTLTDSAATSLVAALVEFQVDHDAPLTLCAGLLPSAVPSFVEAASASGLSVLARAGNGVVYAHVSDEIIMASAAGELLEPLAALARTGGGTLMVDRCEPDWQEQLISWGDPQPSWPLMRRIKDVLDPRGLLSPGRGIDAVMPVPGS